MKTLLASVCFVALLQITANSASAQCNTCAPAATPIVAYSPVVQSTTTYEPYRGWYLGKWLDNMRMRRWGYSEPTTVTATTVGYVPTTAAYAPYTAGYTPYTASYTPYTVNNYMPVSYSTPYVTAYAPLGQRQALMRPVVVGSPVVSSGCATCSAPAPCSACSSCDPCSSCAGSVQAATYSAPASYSTPACSSCSGSGSSITYSTPSSSSSSSQMSAPALTPQEAAPLRSDYPPASDPASDEVVPQNDPGPSESSTYFEAPKLFNPQDRTAQNNSNRAKPINRSPSVDVWTAVYSKPVTTDNISTTTTKRSQAEIDAAGWHSVPAK